MTFDSWMKNRCRDSLDWVTECEILLKNGLIRFERWDKYETTERNDRTVCNVCENLVLDGFGAGAPGHPCKGSRRKPKGKGCRYP